MDRLSPGPSAFLLRKSVWTRTDGKLIPNEALQEQKVKLISELAMLYVELIKNVRKQCHKQFK